MKIYFASAVLTASGTVTAETYSENYPGKIRKDIEDFLSRALPLEKVTLPMDRDRLLREITYRTSGQPPLRMDIPGGTLLLCLHHTGDLLESLENKIRDAFEEIPWDGITSSRQKDVMEGVLDFLSEFYGERRSTFNAHTVLGMLADERRWNGMPPVQECRRLALQANRIMHENGKRCVLDEPACTPDGIIEARLRELDENGEEKSSRLLKDTNLVRFMRSLQEEEEASLPF